MKKVLYLVVALSLLLGFQSDVLAAQTTPPPISSADGEYWLFDVSGIEQGGAVLKFVREDTDPATDPDPTTETGTITGYGFTRTGGPIDVDGTFEINIMKGTITGTYNLGTNPAMAGNLTGKADKRRRMISLKLFGGLNAKGIKLTAGPDSILGAWFVTGRGQGGARVTMESLSLDLDSELPYRVYTLYGEGENNDIEHPSIKLEGKFFLTAKSVAYGVYTAKDVSDDEIIETGVFTGKVNLSSNKFVFKLISSEGDPAVMKGEKLLP